MSVLGRWVRRRRPTPAVVGAGLAGALLAASAVTAPVRGSTADQSLPAADPVVVATLDTGVNPFHPCFRRPGHDPRQAVPGYPAGSLPVGLQVLDSHARSVEASGPALDGIVGGALHHVTDTNISFFSSAPGRAELLDTYGHGALAASQIACDEYGLGANAQLVVVNTRAYGGSTGFEVLRWVAAQPWIDVVHVNMQDWPLLVYRTPPELRAVVESGKLLVVAAGNGVAGAGVPYPAELSRVPPPGALVIGKNDNTGVDYNGNIDPHVVMDGFQTAAAEPSGFGTTSFGGTSSSSALAAGYTARLLGAARRALGHAGPGMLRVPDGWPRPTQGPVADGVLSADELHAVIRRTASATHRTGRYDGAGRDVTASAPPPAVPFSLYPKWGYGEIDEATVQAALDVLIGAAPMPDRPIEDGFYGESERLRATLDAEVRRV